TGARTVPRAGTPGRAPRSRSARATYGRSRARARATARRPSPLPRTRPRRPRRASSAGASRSWSGRRGVDEVVEGRPRMERQRNGLVLPLAVPAGRGRDHERPARIPEAVEAEAIEIPHELD